MEIIAPILQKYVSEHSEVWNDFKIVTRFGEIDEIGGIPCEKVHGTAFRSTCTMYADTIHLSHGRPEK